MGGNFFNSRFSGDEFRDPPTEEDLQVRQRSYKNPYNSTVFFSQKFRYGKEKDSGMDGTHGDALHEQ